MAVELKDVEEVAEALGKKFDEFKTRNDKRVDALEEEKGKLAGQVESLNGKLSELDDLKTALEKELAAIKRPGGGGSSKEAAAHKSAFMQFVRKGKDDGLAEIQHKALQTTVDSDGGYAVPEELDRNILQLLRDESPMRAVCGQMTISTQEYKKLVNLGGSGSGWVGETDARPATGTPTLAQIAAIMGEIYANPQATQTSLDDLFFDAEGWLNGEVATEFLEREGSAFLLGDGTHKPKGLLSYAMNAQADKDRPFGTIQAVASGVAGSFDTDALIKLLYTLKKGYRANAQWMMATMTMFKVRTLKDAEGNYIWQPGLQINQPASLLGYGIAENEDMPAVAADANAISFGDYKRAYMIVDRMGTRVLRDPYTSKPNVGFYTTKRVGGMLTDSRAVKVLSLKTA